VRDDLEDEYDFRTPQAYRRESNFYGDSEAMDGRYRRLSKG
jgi:hypothetical protein